MVFILHACLLMQASILMIQRIDKGDVRTNLKALAVLFLAVALLAVAASLV
jgi:hypothetical protein